MTIDYSILVGAQIHIVAAIKEFAIVNNAAPTTDDLAAITGFSVSYTRRMLTELSDAGVVTQGKGYRVGRRPPSTWSVNS